MKEAELKKHLDAAEKSPKEIAAAVSGLPDKNMRYKPSADKWCILEVLGHLADIEIVFAHRFRQMLADTKPVIAPMDQDAWAQQSRLHGNSRAGVDCALRIEPASHSAIIAALETERPGEICLPPRTQTGCHSRGLHREDGRPRRGPPGSN